MTTGTDAMAHEGQQALIPDLLSGGLNRWQRWKVNRHLKSCEECHTELERYEAIQHGLQDLVAARQAEYRPSADFVARIRETVAAQPFPSPDREAGFPWITKVAVPGVTVALAVLAIVLALTLTGGNGASALSLATPVRGTVSITQGGDPVLDSTFSYVSPDTWERSTTHHRRPESVKNVSEVSVDGETFSRLGDEPWRPIGATPADRQIIPGLGELALTERLFDAVLNVYQLEEGGERQFRGEQLREFTGIDAGYAANTRDSSLASGGSQEEAQARFEFYTANPPEVTVLADSQERIRAIFITLQLADVPDPGLIEVVIDEFNAQVEIASPLP